jgi:hypothetical protein
LVVAHHDVDVVTLLDVREAHLQAAHQHASPRRYQRATKAMTVAGGATTALARAQ